MPLHPPDAKLTPLTSLHVLAVHPGCVYTWKFVPRPQPTCLSPPVCLIGSSHQSGCPTYLFIYLFLDESHFSLIVIVIKRQDQIMISPD